MNLVKVRGIADHLRLAGKYEDALHLYDTVREQIWGALGSVQNELATFSQTFLGDSLRTSVQFKNSYSQQAVSNTFHKWFSLDLDQTCNEFIFSTYGRLQCYSQSLYLCAAVTTDIILSEFLILQTLVLNAGTDNWVNSVYKLATPNIEGERMKKIRFTLPEVAVRKIIVENAEKIKKTDWYNINIAILEYMTNIGDSTSEFYNSISRVVGPYSHKYRGNPRSQDSAGADKQGAKKEKFSYEQYERYEKYERFERFEKRTQPQVEEEFDYAKATEYERAKHFGRVLGLSGKVTKSTIKKRYLELIAKYHPDRVDDLGDELKVLAEKKTKELNAAYEWMKKKYDL
ncbi:MAG: J domain-containing protein [Ignavibacteria bacterium]|nr:J domain-containing protein [Ignavibacteria bacterium]